MDARGDLQCERRGRGIEVGELGELAENSEVGRAGAGAQQEGMPPQVDLMGARQTIDTLSLLKDKTKGNLTSKEESLLQNALYEMRMAYVEVTNAIAKNAQQVPAAK